MRKYVVIAYAIALSLRPVQAQNYKISFEGIGASDVVDSVKVENITQGTSFTVAGNDNLSLSRSFPTKINSLVSGGIKSLLIYPNPTNSTTYVEFTPACPGASVIAVYDMSGKLILRELADLDDSPQRFILSGVRNGMYLIKVTGRTYRYSGKLISINPDFGNIKIERLSPFAFRKEDNKEKASNDHKGSHDDPEIFYNYGDRLKLTGYSGVYTTIALGEPVSDTTITFDFIPCTDGDYNNYPVVKIGTQIWMAENLRTTRFNNAKEIPNITDENLWWNVATPAYFNQPGNTYGALYNWQAASSGMICPTGWHVPDTSEISILSGYLENQSEFTFDPGDWWLTTEIDLTNAFCWSLKYNSSKEYVYQADKQNGHYVKCIKDSEVGDTELWNSYCPTRLVLSPDIYTNEMDSALGWSLLGEGSTLEVNEDQKHSGTGALKVTTGVGVTTTLSRIVNISLNDLAKSVKLWMYLHSDKATSISTVQLLLASGPSWWTNYVKCTLSVSLTNFYQETWTLRRDMNWNESAGNIDWNAINYLHLVIYPKAGQVAIVSFDLLTMGIVTKPACLITFDDACLSQFTKAYPILKVKKMVATAYINSQSIGAEGVMTVANLKELNANNWDIANHGKTHAHFPLLKQKQIEDDLELCKVYLNGLGITKGVDHVAYPFGEYNAATIAALINWGAKTGRTTKPYNNVYDTFWPYEIQCKSIHNTDSLDTIKTYVDSCVLYGRSFVLLFHFIEDNNPTSNTTTWLTSDFHELINYIESIELQTLTIDEYYRLYSGGITVHHK